MRFFLSLTTALLLAPALSGSPASTAEAGKPTPVPSYTGGVWGDILCSGQIDAGDAIPVLGWLSGVPGIAPPAGCPQVFFGVAVQGYQGNWRWADVDCSDAISLPDVTAILRAAASLPSVPANGCPTIAQTYPIAIVGK